MSEHQQQLDKSGSGAGAGGVGGGSAPPGSPRNGSGSASLQPTVRSRVSQACETCRKRKVKCNGQEPCSYCLSSGKICTFKEVTDNAALSRQHANSVDSRLLRVEETLRKFEPMSEAFNAFMRKNGSSAYELPFLIPRNKSDADGTAAPAQGGHIVVPPRKQYKPSAAILKLAHNPAQGPSPSLSFQHGLMSPGQGEAMAEEDNDERWFRRASHLTKDSYGNLRFIGGTSSAVFVDALTTLQQEPTTDQSPDSSQSAGKNVSSVDLPMPFFNRGVKFREQDSLPRPEDIAYPSNEDADDLVAIYFAEIHHTFPILHQQTFLERYRKVMEAHAVGKPSKEHAFLTCVFAVWACGACIAARRRRKTKDGGKEEDGVQAAREFRGYTFYEKANLLFWIGSGASHIEHVQALALLAICNASWNTLAASWINAGQAIRRAQDLGLHRRTRHNIISPLEKEIRRRIWWCAYGLDRVLSIALGRPSGTHDDDCDAEMPLELDDTQLLKHFESGELKDPKTNNSYMIGYPALLQIYIIAGNIMRFTHSPKLDDVQSAETQQTLASFQHQLDQWSNNLPVEVRNSWNDGRENPRMFTLCLIAYFVYYSAVINLHRPFIPEYMSPDVDMQSIGQCLNAACSCIKIGEVTIGMLPTSHHLAFAVQYITLSGVILLRCLAFVSNRPDIIQNFLSDAEKCIEILRAMEEAWPASRRCREIVTDLLSHVRTQMGGGAEEQSEVERRLKVQREREEASKSPLVATDPSGLKRKRSEEADEETEGRDGDGNMSSSRPRLESSQSWQRDSANGDGISGRESNREASSSSAANGGGYLESYPPPLPSSSSHKQQRVSNLRTSVADGVVPSSKPNVVSPHQSHPPHHPQPGHGQQQYYPQAAPQQQQQQQQPPRHQAPQQRQHPMRSASMEQYPGRGGSQMYSPSTPHVQQSHHHQQQYHHPSVPSHHSQQMLGDMLPPGSTGHGGYSSATHDARGGVQQEGDMQLPFGEYNFLGENFAALVGEVVRPPVPPGQQVEPAMMEENAAYLVRTYNGVNVGQPFSAGPPGHQGGGGHP